MDQITNKKAIPAALRHILKGLCVMLALFTFQTTKAQNMPDQSLASYEKQAKKFKPENGLAAKNTNDLRLFVYEWFTNFEHASKVDFYLGHLDNSDMSLSFPGQTPLTTHAGYTKWYDNLLAQTLWNFHDISSLQIKKTGTKQFLVTFLVNWYGEVKASSDQLAGWQSRKDSNIYHYTLRQSWTVKDSGQKWFIQKLLVTPGDTPSPISN